MPFKESDLDHLAVAQAQTQFFFEESGATAQTVPSACPPSTWLMGPDP